MNNNQSPWGGNASGSQSPPDLEEVINDFKNKFSNIFGGNKGDNAEIISGKSPVTGKFKFIIILLLSIWMLSGIYIIDPAERGVVMRFSAFVEQTAQGPHWHLPYPIETVTVVNVSESRKIEVGFRNLINKYGAKVTRKIPAESLMLTKDGNIVDASFEIQYNISSAKEYLFNVLYPEKTLEQVVNSAIREVVGIHKMDFIITEGRAEIAQEVKKKSQELLDNYKVGLHINTVNFHSAQAPEQVQSSYSDVTKSKTDKKRYINQAESYANDILPKANGASARQIEEANAYKSQVVSKSEGEASRFEKILLEYEKAPVVTKKRLYLETLEKIFANTSKVINDSKAGSIMYLPIDKLINNKANNTRVNNVNGEPMNSDSNSKNANSNSNIRNVFRNRGGK